MDTVNGLEGDDVWFATGFEWISCHAPTPFTARVVPPPTNAARPVNMTPHVFILSPTRSTVDFCDFLLGFFFGHDAPPTHVGKNRK